jgi:hypothetical protein
MKAGKTILFTCLGAAAFGTAGYGYYRYVQKNIDIMPSGFNLQRPDSQTVNITLKFLVTNNTGLAFSIKSTDCNIFFNNSFLGVAKMQDAVTVPANTKTVITVISSFNKNNLESTALSVISGLFTGGGKMNFTVSGNSRVTVNTWVPVTVNYAINEVYSI